jgi:acyl-CoA synthetase (AMP-forming)/AMP-acid ligase II
MGSAPASRSLVNKLKENFRNARIIISYGLSEIGPSLFGKHPDNIPTPELSVGYPIKEIEYRLSNNILEIKSPSMMLDYINIEKSRFTDDGFYITNDLFEIDEQGFYFFKGRADDMFVSGGNNIFPRNIEIVLEENEMVFQSAVVAVSDEHKGNNPYAFLVLKKETEFFEKELENYCRQRLFPFECPRKFWKIDEMPLNEVGKIDKKKLQKMAEEMLN